MILYVFFYNVTATTEIYTLSLHDALPILMQSIFIGGTIAWFAFRSAVEPMGWERDRTALWWNQFHGGFVAVTLGIALVVTIYSFVIYLYRYRGMFSQQSQ